jgi:hypothetical protein
MAGLWIALAPAAAASDGDDLVSLEQARSEAIAKKDVAFPDRLYADDFHGVTALGYEVDKATLMGIFGRDNPNTRFALDKLEARLLGDVGIITGRLTGRDLAGAISSQSLYMHVYARRGSHWVIVAGQGTFIQKERWS